MNNIYKQYSKELSKMISNVEFKKMLGNSVNNKILKYPDLENINDLNEILTEPKDYRIILILTQGNEGHWTTITVNNGNEYVWFDSYGLKPDAEFDFISPEMQSILDEKDHILTNLLNKAVSKGGSWTYNNIKFQLQQPNINTCGRWTAAYSFLFLKQNYSLEQFQQYFINWKKQTNLPFDILVCEFTKVLD
jgi:hypothetical protein